MKLIRELLENFKSPIELGTYINLRYIGYRIRGQMIDRRLLPQYSTINVHDVEPFYKDDPTGLFTVSFTTEDGTECMGVYSDDDFENAFFKGTKREYHMQFLKSLKDE